MNKSVIPYYCDSYDCIKSNECKRFVGNYDRDELGTVYVTKHCEVNEYEQFEEI